MCLYFGSTMKEDEALIWVCMVLWANACMNTMNECNRYYVHMPRCVKWIQQFQFSDTVTQHLLFSVQSALWEIFVSQSSEAGGYMPTLGNYFHCTVTKVRLLLWTSINQEAPGDQFPNSGTFNLKSAINQVNPIIPFVSSAFPAN